LYPVPELQKKSQQCQTVEDVPSVHSPWAVSTQVTEYFMSR